MDNECNEDEREFRYATFHQAIYAIENDIKKELLSTDISAKKYIPFGLVNKGICQKYRFLLNTNFDKNAARKQVMNYKDLVKKNQDKDFRYISNNFKFTLPSNFIFVNNDFLDVVSNYIPQQYTNKIGTIFNTIIGGECIIMKNPNDKKDEYPFRFLILYSEIKEYESNEIDFFIYITDKKERQYAEEYILKNNLWNYFKKIRYNYKDEYKKICNEMYKEIGYVVRCCEINKIENYIQKVNSLKGLRHKKSQINQNIMFNPSPIEQANSLINFNPDVLFNPVITFLFQIDELKTYLGLSSIVDLQTFKNIILGKIGPNLNEIKNYQNTFEILLNSLDQGANKEHFSLSEQYDEDRCLKKFMEKHKNGNIIQKYFLIPKEEVILCKKCRMHTFQCKYDNYIYIQNPLTDLIYQKMFQPKKEQKKGKRCNFCNGQETELSIEEKVLDYPEKLIVIIDQTQVNNFNIGLNLAISNGNNISYSLNQFIEANTNILYQINPNNTSICHSFGRNATDNIENKKPIVLFYKIKKCNLQFLQLIIIILKTT